MSSESHCPKLTGSGPCKSGLPLLSLDTSDFRPQDRFEIWRDYSRPGLEIDSFLTRSVEFNAAVQAWRTGSAVFISSNFPSMNFVRGPSEVRAIDHEHVVLRYIKSGSLRMLQGDTPIILRAGEVHLLDLRQRIRASTEGVEQISVFLPYAAIGYDPSKNPSHISFMADAPITHVIKTILESTLEFLPGAAASSGPEVADSLAGMLRGLVSGRCLDYHGDARAEQLTGYSMRVFLNDNLHDPNVGVETLCRTFAVSRAAVYRLFGPHGGVGRYLMRQRLNRAFWELVREPLERDSIQSVALRCGFSGAQSFARAFRAKFGINPNDVSCEPDAAAKMLNVPSLSPTHPFETPVSRLDDLLSSH